MTNETKAMVILVLLSCAITFLLYKPLFIERRTQRESAKACQKEWDAARNNPRVDHDTGLTMYPIPDCDSSPIPHMLPLLEHIDWLKLMITPLIFFLTGIVLGIISFIRQKGASGGSCFLHLSAALFGISAQQQIVLTYPEFGMISYIFIFAILTSLLIAWIFGSKSKSRSLRMMKYTSIIYFMLLIIWGFSQLWEAFSMFYFLICIGGCIIILWQKRNPDVLAA